MQKLGLIRHFVVALGPDWLKRLVHGRKQIPVDGRPIDLSALAVGELALAVRPPGKEPVLTESRQGLRTLAARLDLPCPAKVATRDMTLDGAAGPLPVRLYDTDLAATDRPALLFLHGGGWVQGGIDTHDGLCGQLALESACRVLSLGYRLAPEHPWPAAPDDVLAAWRALNDDPALFGIDPARLAVGGDSAGGNLAAVLIHDLAATGAAVPAAQLLIYPALDSGFATPSMHSLRQAYLLPRDRMEWYKAQYLPEGSDPDHPRVAPARSPYPAAAPPTLILTAGHDPLRDDGAEHATRLQQAGVDVTYREFPGQIHVFVSVRRAIPEGRAAVTWMAGWLAQRLGAGQAEA
ncbi:MAG: alpha/beta hydrolase [Pararhodobacter sp.]|nr:alpha/beta hydrolase [Pararhodobacter sp.]